MSLGAMEVVVRGGAVWLDSGVWLGVIEDTSRVPLDLEPLNPGALETLGPTITTSTPNGGFSIVTGIK